MSVRALLSVLFQVNENFAIDLIAEQPVSQVGSRVISCDGGGGALGHPRVYINLVTSCLAPAPVPVLVCPRWPHTLGSAWPMSHPLGPSRGRACTELPGQDRAWGWAAPCGRSGPMPLLIRPGSTPALKGASAQPLPLQAPSQNAAYLWAGRVGGDRADSEWRGARGPDKCGSGLTRASSTVSTVGLRGTRVAVWF